MTGAPPKEPPRMTIFAGPNGSGKSTVVDALKDAEGFPPYINADVIAKEELGHIEDTTARNLKAASLAEERRNAALERGESFAFESVFSTPGKIGLIDEAKKRGYVVDLIFVTTANPEINVVRVEARAGSGGHRVTEDKIRERYERAMELLPAAFLRVDAAQVFDNSKDLEIPQLVATKEISKVEYASNPPEWVARRLIEPVNARIDSKEKLLNFAHSSNPDAMVTDAGISGNPVYSGVVVGLSPVHALQRLAGSADQYVLHDLVLTGGRTLQTGKSTAISYVFGPDGKHVHAGPALRPVNQRSR